MNSSRVSAVSHLVSLCVEREFSNAVNLRYVASGYQMGFSIAQSHIIQYSLFLCLLFQLHSRRWFIIVTLWSQLCISIQTTEFLILWPTNCSRPQPKSFMNITKCLRAAACLSASPGPGVVLCAPVSQCADVSTHVTMCRWCPVMLTMWTLPGTRESGYIHGHSHLAFTGEMKHLLKHLDMQMMFTGHTC